MKLCLNQSTTLSTSFEEDLPAYAQSGWAAIELWLTKLETFVASHSIAEARQRLEFHGLSPAGASFQGGLLLSQGEERTAHWDHFGRRLELLAALGVPTLVIAADFPSEASQDDYSRATESLAQAAERAISFGVRLALEFQKTSRFCASLDTALALVAGSEAEGLGVCLDLFHFYTGPSKLEDLAYLSRDNLAWVQACDVSGVPREIARDADRILPGEGDFQLGPIFEHLSRIGYDGYVSLELMNPQFWQIPPSFVADVGHRALLRTLELGRPSGADHHPSGGK
jgi:2-keto-myo-inositol isomerase